MMLRGTIRRGKMKTRIFRDCTGVMRAQITLNSNEEGEFYIDVPLPVNPDGSLEIMGTGDVGALPFPVVVFDDHDGIATILCTR